MVMAATIFFDVDMASSFKDLIANSDSVKFGDDAVKDFILKSDDDSFLLVKKKIGSDVTILSADKVDDDLLKSILL
jgi:hypothetical protein